MTDLIERLKAATEGNAELDAAIADAIDREDAPEHLTPRYSRSLDAAVTLVPAGLFWGAGSTATNYAWAGVKQFAGAATPALALCIAALMARKATP